MGQGSRISSQGLATPQQYTQQAGLQGSQIQQGTLQGTLQGSQFQQGTLQGSQVQGSQFQQQQGTLQGSQFQQGSLQGSQFQQQFQSTPGSTNKEDSSKKEEPRTGGSQYQPYRRY